jgi:hypothetical protein
MVEKGESGVIRQKHLFAVGILIAVALAATISQPVWFLVMALGIVANWLVTSLNQGRMPVWGWYDGHEDCSCHCLLTSRSRFIVLADIIPTGWGAWWGRASIGDFLIWGGIVGVVATHAFEGWLTYVRVITIIFLVAWITGWAKGFHLSEKWADEIMRQCRKGVSVTMLMVVLGNLIGFRGCGQANASLLSAVRDTASGDNKKSVQALIDGSRSLGKVNISQEFLTRLRIATADYDAKGVQARKTQAALDAPIQKQMAEIQRDPISHVQTARLRDLQNNASTPTIIAQNSHSFIYKTYDGAIRRWTLGGEEELAPAVKQQPTEQWNMTWTATMGTVMMAVQRVTFQRIGTRKGPFCRVTCEFHHKDNLGAGTGDVELDADYCTRNTIPKEDIQVPGWYAVDAQYEHKTNWPGPARGGLDSYKLYWK